MIHYEIQQFHRQCLRMMELVRSRTLDRRDVNFLDGSVEAVKAEVESFLDGEHRREATMITDGTQREYASCPMPEWNGPYWFPCGRGDLAGVCPRHGRFR